MDFKEMHDTIEPEKAGTPAGLFTPEELHYSRLNDYAKLIVPRYPDTLLDLGAGYGELLETLGAHMQVPKKYVAVEGSDVVYAHMKERLAPAPLETEVVTHHDHILNFCLNHDERYDFCVMAGILAFVPDEDVEGYLSSAVKMTGKYLLFTFHDSALYDGKFHSHDMGFIQSKVMGALEANHRTLKATTITHRENNSQITVLVELDHE